MKNDFKNHEGYYDPTAGKAIKNMMGGREVEIHRGDIFKREKRNQPGYDFILVVSREERCKGGTNVICVRLDEEKEHLIETQTNVVARGVRTACCDIMFYAYRGEIGEYIRTATTEEMQAVNECMAKALGLELGNAPYNEQQIIIDTESEPVEAENISDIDVEMLASLYKEIDDYMIQVAKLEAERDIYKQQAESLLDRIIGAKAG